MAARHRVRIRFFHGRGGSMSRGRAPEELESYEQAVVAAIEGIATGLDTTG